MGILETFESDPTWKLAIGCILIAAVLLAIWWTIKNPINPTRRRP